MADRVELVDHPIDPDGLMRGLAAPSDGAVALFLGVVRDANRGRRVLRLEYHAYPEMAVRVMREIAAEARSRFEASSLAMVHRLGSLTVGDVSVAVAAAAPHRGTAFDACRHAMERLKHEVPIWKKEHFDGGEIWIEGSGSSSSG